MTFKERMTHFIEAGFQILFIPTTERSRCEQELLALARELGMDFVTWDSVDGFQNGAKGTVGQCKDPIEALLSMDPENAESIWKKKKEVLFVMRNLHSYLEEPQIRQALQNLYYARKINNNEYKRPIVILSNVLNINQEISSCMNVAEFSLPDEKELGNVFSAVMDSVEVDPEKPGANIKYDEAMKLKTVQAMRGMTTLEAENLLAFSLRVNRGFSPDLIDTLEDQKARSLEKSEVLTYIPKNRIATMNEIGGYESLKDFIAVRKLAYTQQARDLNMDLPRGIVLLGIPGSGKSMAGKVIARELGLPLVMLNVSAIFGSLVGESERRIRTALATIDALDGAVALVDEAEKALGGASESVGDSGVSRRVFGVILTWLTEKTSRTFVVMTMNKTTGIPPEFLRKGRFDEIFYTDIPDPRERDEILKIHCRKRNIDTTAYNPKDWELLVKSTEEYVGAELEQLICDARFASFAARQTGQPTIEELMVASQMVVPISKSEAESMEAIKKLCVGRGRPVSKQQAPTPMQTPKTSKPSGRAITLN